MAIWKTAKGNKQVMVCKNCGDVQDFITESKPMDGRTMCERYPDMVRGHTINEIANEIHKNAVNKGWWENPSPDGTQIALFHAELSEALESMRKGEPAEWFQPPLMCARGFKQGDIVNTSKLPVTENLDIYEGQKTEGWATELIDCVIRIFDFLVAKNINVEDVLVRKHEYNKTREYKHGKRF